MKSAVTRIQLPEPKSAVGQSQPQLGSSRWNSSQPQLVFSRVSWTDISVGILDFNYDYFKYNYVY